MEDSVHVKGLSDLNKFMEQLTPKLEANVMRGALRAGMNVVKPIAQSNIHSVSGELAKGLKVGTRIKGNRVISYLKVTGVHAFLAKWVEFGTKAHNIAAKVASTLSFGGIFTKSVAHPGAKPHPFMRPALDAMAGPAVVAAAEYMKKRLATKEGFDTSSVLIQGDEP